MRLRCKLLKGYFHPPVAVLAGAVSLARIVGGVAWLVAGWRARTEAGAAVDAR
jgi:hypothetical protein